MCTGKILLTLTWLVAIVLVVGLGATFEQASQQFFGITDNREQAVSFSHPVEIVEARVVEGEEVEPGAPMLRLRRPDLKSEVEVLDHQIAEIDARRLETAVTLQGETSAVEQDRKVRTAELDTEIAELEERHRIDLDMVRSISGTKVANSAGETSPVQAKLSGLRTERSRVAEAAASRIEALGQRLAARAVSEQARLAELRARRGELLRQQANLSVAAKYHGRVGSVLYRPGDVVPAFAAIVTLHSLAPELVKGYIHEDVYNEVSEGRQVWVRSMTSENSELLIGIVESLGSRIVAYPERLLKNPGAPAWGREVVVRLDKGNRLLLGERVAISLRPPKSLQERVAPLLRRGMESVLGVPEALAWCGAGPAGSESPAACQSLVNR